LRGRRLLAGQPKVGKKKEPTLVEQVGLIDAGLHESNPKHTLLSFGLTQQKY